MLVMEVYPRHGDIARDPTFLAKWDADTDNWGEPLVEPDFWPAKAPCQDTDKLFWEEKVPIFVF
jgi:hypothetical protein